MYKKYKPPLHSIPEKRESQDDLPANWIPKKKHEVLRVKYKCLKRLFKVYDSQINNLIEEYLKLRVNSEDNITKNPGVYQETGNYDMNSEKNQEDNEFERNCLEQSTTTNSLDSLNVKLQKCTIGPLLFEVIGDHLTDISSRESLKQPGKSPTNNLYRDIQFKTEQSEDGLDGRKQNSASLPRKDLQVNNVLNIKKYDDFKSYFDKGMETSTQDLLESILACTQTSKSLFEDSTGIYLTRKLSPIQYLRRKLCNRNRPSTTKSDIVDRRTKTCHSLNTTSPNRATAVSEPIYGRRRDEARKTNSCRRRCRRKINFKHFNNSSRNRMTSKQDLICEPSNIGDLGSNSERCAFNVTPRSPVEIEVPSSSRPSRSIGKQGNNCEYNQTNNKFTANAKVFQYPDNYSEIQNRQNTFRIQSQSPTKKTMYKCSFCHKEFKLKFSKDIHENTRHSFTKLVNRFTTFSKENDAPYFDTPIRKEPPVEVLTPVIRRVRRYNRHKKTSENRVYNRARNPNCRECDTIFLNREDLDFHIRLTHDVSKYHMCKICSLHFESRSELTEHFEQYHVEDESTCGSFFDYDEKSTSEDNMFVNDPEQRNGHETQEYMKNRFRKYNSVSASSSMNTKSRKRNTIPDNSYKSISQKSRSSPIFRRRNSTDSSDSVVSNNDRNFEEIKRDLIESSYQKNNRNHNSKNLNQRHQTASKMQSM